MLFRNLYLRKNDLLQYWSINDLLNCFCFLLNRVTFDYEKLLFNERYVSVFRIPYG